METQGGGDVPYSLFWIIVLKWIITWIMWLLKALVTATCRQYCEYEKYTNTFYVARRELIGRFLFAQ